MTPVLLHEIIGFSIPCKMDSMALLLHIMPEMETPGCMPEPLTADNKEDLHQLPAYRFVLVPDELLVCRSGQGGEMTAGGSPGVSGMRSQAMI
jgi:hypothetical protein